MNAFFYYFYNFMRTFFGHIWNVLVAIKDAIIGIFDIRYYMELFNTYKDDLSVFGWIAAIIVHILMITLLALFVYLIWKGLKIVFRFKVPVAEYEKMKDEVVTLKREIMKANYQKDKILAMKISELGMELNADLLDTPKELFKAGDVFDGDMDEKNADEMEELEDDNKVEVVETKERRFPRLSGVDLIYKDPGYQPPEYDYTITLEEVCINFRNFAASRLGLYYDLEVMKQAFASFGAAKMLILQGISGTGKTSLPYAFGQFIQNPSVICSVQPSWRDRTELFGYYNDFTKKYTETDFLKTLYEAHYYEDPRIVILDEMNIARVEYYFAEMLSILELPREEERFVSVVSNTAASDPELMKEGKIWIPNNIWYVGTINNDDSTFAVADKVYDRAIPIDLDDRAEFFEAPDTEPQRLSYKHLERLYEDAKKKYPISEENLILLDKLDKYLIEHFRLTFGNRIMRQLKELIPSISVPPHGD